MNEEFGTIIQRAILMLTGFTAQKLEDGEISDSELDQIQEEFETCIAAIEYERECRDQARQSATSHNADKNNAEKI
jgi:hypothetical protein